MSNKHRNRDRAPRSLEMLREWQRERLERDRELPTPAPGPSEVTLVAYCTPAHTASAESFSYLECAIRETWRHCGFVHTVVVCAEPFEPLAAFAKPYGRHVEVQLEPSLKRGADALHADINGRLVTRFRTHWALLVRDDAFPIRPGIGTFLDGADFVGASRGDAGALSRFFDWIFGRHAMDGRFSLRSRTACTMAAEEWRMRYADRDTTGPAFEDGAFYTHLLPTHSRKYRSGVKLADRSVARLFSHAGGAFHSQIPPFGFSGANAFRALKENAKFGI